MWYDNFDADLYSLIPEAEEIIRPLANIRLVCNGIADKDGKLNHPAVFNSDHTMLAFFDLAPSSSDEFIRSIPVVIAPTGYVPDDRVIVCTFEEAVRDAWLHHYQITVRTGSSWYPILDTFQVQQIMVDLMHNKRGIFQKTPEVIEKMKATVVRKLKVAVERMQLIVKDAGVTV